MDVLLTYGLSAVLFLALEVFWCWPSRRSRVTVHAGADLPPEAAPLPVGWDPFALTAVHDRMDALAAELARLEDDEVIFAKAFRTHVAKAAYEALLADANRLGNASRLTGFVSPAGATTIEVDIPGPSTQLQEELRV